MRAHEPRHWGDTGRKGEGETWEQYIQVWVFRNKSNISFRFYFFSAEWILYQCEHNLFNDYSNPKTMKHFDAIVWNVCSDCLRQSTHSWKWNFGVKFRSLDLLHREHVIFVDEVEMKVECVPCTSVSVSGRRRRVNSFRLKIIICWDLHRNKFSAPLHTAWRKSLREKFMASRFPVFHFWRWIKVVMTRVESYDGQFQRRCHGLRIAMPTNHLSFWILNK